MIKKQRNVRQGACSEKMFTKSKASFLPAVRQVPLHFFWQKTSAFWLRLRHSSLTYRRTDMLAPHSLSRLLPDGRQVKILCFLLK
jgi:hypothetical protein